MNKKIGLIIVFVLLVGTVLTGCGDDPTAAEVFTEAYEKTAEEQKVRTIGQITIEASGEAVEQQLAPMGMSSLNMILDMDFVTDIEQNKSAGTLSASMDMLQFFLGTDTVDVDVFVDGDTTYVRLPPFMANGQELYLRQENGTNFDDTIAIEDIRNQIAELMNELAADLEEYCTMSEEDDVYTLLYEVPGDEAKTLFKNLVKELYTSDVMKSIMQEQLSPEELEVALNELDTVLDDVSLSDLIYSTEIKDNLIVSNAFDFTVSLTDSKSGASVDFNFITKEDREYGDHIEVELPNIPEEKIIDQDSMDPIPGMN